MIRDSVDLKNRTNVRFLAAIVTTLLVAGCGTIAPLGSQLQPCPTAGPALCESFGPESRCSCADTSVISRELDRFNRSAQLGPRGW